MIEKITSLSHNPIASKIVKNILWLFFDKILKMGVGVFVFVLMARHLGPENFGLFNYIVALVSLFGAIAVLGLNAIVVKELVEDSNKEKILGTTFVLRITGAVVSYFFLVLTIYLLRPNDDLSKYLIVIIGISLLFASSDVVKYWFESQINSKYAVIVENSVFLVFAVVKLFLIYNNASIEAYVYVAVVESVFLFFGLFYMYYKQGKLLNKWHFNKEKAKNLLSQSWPLIVSSAAWIIYTKIDQIMIGQMLSDEEVGYYSAASRLSEVANFLPAIITLSIVPALIKLRLKNDILYNYRFQQLYYLVVTLMVVVAIIATLFSELIITFLYGEIYLSSASVLSIHFWIVIITSLAIVSGKYLVNAGLQKITMQRHIIGVLLNIPLNYFMIPVYGINGSAIASLLSLFVANYVFDLLQKETRMIFIQKTKALCFYWLIDILKGKENNV